MADERDLLTDIAKDPRLLRKVLEEIDADRDHKLTTAELTKWMSKHANELNMDGHNFGEDLKKLGANALKASPKIDPKEELTPQAMQDRMTIDRDHQLLNDEAKIVVETLLFALDDNRELLNKAVTNAQQPQTKEEIEEARIAAETKKFVTQQLKVLEKSKENVHDPKVLADIAETEKMYRASLNESEPKPSVAADPAVTTILGSPETKALEKNDPANYAKLIAGIAEEISSTRKELSQYTVQSAPQVEDFRPLITPNTPERSGGREK